MNENGLISERSAIDAISTCDKFGVDERSRIVRWHEGLEPYVRLRDVVTAIVNLPSAQPEIIRCKDCRYSVDEYDDGDCYCKRSCSWHGANWDFYCAAAERREE